MAEYEGREVDLDSPFRLSDDEDHKFGVYVKNPDTENVNIVKFGDPDMDINRDDPGARKSFRARHDCDNKTDKTTAGYWSCQMWRADKSVEDMLDESKLRKVVRQVIHESFRTDEPSIVMNGAPREGVYGLPERFFIRTEAYRHSTIADILVLADWHSFESMVRGGMNDIVAIYSERERDRAIEDAKKAIDRARF